MNILFVLIPITLIFVVIAGFIFFWAVRSDQFEDLERQGMNIVLDEDTHTNPEKKDKQQ